METSIKRPPSVWIAQILLLIFALFFSLPILMLLLIPFTAPLIGFVIVFSLFTGLACICLVAFWGLLKRRSHGRWLGAAVLSLILILLVISHFVHAPGPLSYYEYTNNVQWVSGQITTIVIWGLFALLIYRLAFGSAANAFFAKPDTTE